MIISAYSEEKVGGERQTGTYVIHWGLAISAMWPYHHMNDPCRTHQNWVTHSKSAFHMACVWTLKTLGALYVLKQCIISIKIIIYCLDCVVQPNALPNSAKFSLQTWTSIDFLRRHFYDNFCWDKVLHLWISLISIEQFFFSQYFPRYAQKIMILPH